jgi:hypothetical protein
MKKISKEWNMKELKEKLRVKYPQLTDSDMEHEEGKEESMMRMVEYKLHMTKPEMRLIIDQL